MKLQGGYLPSIIGRPAGIIKDISVPEVLEIPLCQGGVDYSPVVSDGATVALGTPLAWADTCGGRLALPSPAAGIVSLHQDSKKTVTKIRLQVSSTSVASTGKKYAPANITAEKIRPELAAAGIWPLIHSTQTGTMPALDGSETPARIIVSFINTEPFRTDAKTLFSAVSERILSGLQFLPCLLHGPDSRIHIVVENTNDSAFNHLVSALQGDPRFQFDTLPARYPAEHPSVLHRALRRQDRQLTRKDPVWVLDSQAILAIGDCLAEGRPLCERVVAVGGPGAASPCYARVRIGTPLDSLVPPDSLSTESILLRGGLFTGEPISDESVVEAGDDGIFVLPKAGEREFMGFVAPGFDRVSAIACFGSALTGASDRHITATLRGERRPCVACGECEKACPVGLLPQILHRYLYRDAIDEAQALGVELCIGCGLCSYICPSKIELRQQFAEAGERLREEREHAKAAHLAHEAQQVRKQRETEKVNG